ncbi:hypothetical protein C1H46_016800 [Malus baccata]|uniref:Uncharacterized protein n=1 Tax=Malus baccata TaxID=106549 RepID=A0A540MFV2_MALBA|nr:hypothetical protein C1H46_016800 [Malus baccata]
MVITTFEAVVVAFDFSFITGLEEEATNGSQKSHMDEGGGGGGGARVVEGVVEIVHKSELELSGGGGGGSCGVGGVCSGGGCDLINYD